MIGNLGHANQFLLENPEDASRRVSLSIAQDFAMLFIAASLGLVFFSSALALVIVNAFPVWIWVTAGIALGCAAIFAGFVLWSAVNAQRGLTSIIAQFVQWQESGRRIAEQEALAKLLADSQAVHVPQPIAVQDNHLVIARETTVRSPQKLLDGVPVCDLIYFIDRFPMVGWGVRDWLNREKLPSGRPLSEFEHYDELVKPFQKAGLLRNRRPGAKGKWTTTDPQEIKKLMGLL